MPDDSGEPPAGHRCDVPAITRSWRQGWADGHQGHVPDALAAERTPTSFDHRATERIGQAWVAEVDGAVAGFVMVVGDEVEQVYVAADQRGSGIAGALLAEAERQVRAAGHDRAWLAVVAGNARARRFYERSGWTDEGPFEYMAAGGIKVPSHRYTKTS
jgi:GNAT superfamily N-acetyltransferase